jgi:hypothetical protein
MDKKLRIMKKIFGTIVLLLAVMASVASCGDEPDGKWEKMKWNDLSGLTKEDGIYIVPATGGTYTFECKNYNPWIDHCSSGYNDVVVSSYTHVYNEWFDVLCNNKNVIVTIAPLTSTSARQLTVELTAGDIFDSFKFEQRP